MLDNVFRIVIVVPQGHGVHIKGMIDVLRQRVRIAAHPLFEHLPLVIIVKMPLIAAAARLVADDAVVGINTLLFTCKPVAPNPALRARKSWSRFREITLRVLTRNIMILWRR